MLDQASHLAPGDVGVWHARTGDAWSDPARVARAFDWLTPAERTRYGRYRHDTDRDMFLLGRVMARHLVGHALGMGPTEWTWTEGHRGRPEVEGSRGLSFNLAHSAGVVVCAVSPDGDVGTDVEYRLRPPTDPQIVRRFCSPAEIRDIEQQGDGWRDRFLKYWTLKEAYLKARGLGIAVPLADVSFTLENDQVRVEFLNSLAGLDTNWAFALRAEDAAHLIAVAAPTRGGQAPRFTIQPFTPDRLP